MNESKIVYLVDRVLNSKGRKLTKLDEYMYWSPFVAHHKPKLQINIQSGKWHCWVSETGGYSIFQLFKKINAQQKHFDELRELVDDDYWGAPRTQKTQKKSVLLPKEFKPLWNGENSVIKTHALSYLHKRGISKEDIITGRLIKCI